MIINDILAFIDNEVIVSSFDTDSKYLQSNINSKKITWYIDSIVDRATILNIDNSLSLFNSLISVKIKFNDNKSKKVLLEMSPKIMCDFLSANNNHDYTSTQIIIS
tara:strand:- start:1282 stop:1599 length:318 start_codon:yes stop_codon:yes gene_type:complete